MTADYAEIRSPALVFKELADRATASADPPLRIITPAHGFTELVVRSVASTDQSKKNHDESRHRGKTKLADRTTTYTVVSLKMMKPSP